MENSVPSLIVLETPSGYGKTYCIKEILPKIYPLKFIHISAFAIDNFFDELREKCVEAGLPYSSSDNTYQWYKALQNSKRFFLVIDDYQVLQKNADIKEFIYYFLKNPIDKLSIIISSNQKIDLPIENYFSSGKAKYVDKKELVLSLEEIMDIWEKNNLEWAFEDEKFYYYSGGWNKAIFIYLQYRKSEITLQFFEEILDKSVNDIFFTEANELNFNNLKLLFEDTTPELFKEKTFNLVYNKVEYWNFLAKNKRLSPEEVQIYLQRSLSIATVENNSKNILNISTRLAHQYSLSGEYDKLSMALDQSEKFTKDDNTVNKIAWLYIKANRLRQLCRHDEAKALLQELLEINCNDIASLNLQTKARVVMGLTEYQLGNYQVTRDYYNNALLLARGENNNSLNLEITIMLAFLDRWEGKENDSLPDNILDLIEEQPLKSQPIMLLNLAFYWLLGEKVDIELTSDILEKIKLISEQLKFKFLIPLIADIEARIMRFKKNYQKAHECHNIALGRLEKESFEYLHAQLNYALTIIRQGDKDKAKTILDNLLTQANKSNAKGMIREIKVLLNEISPDPKKENNVPEIIVKTNNDKEKITIKTFGGFQVEIGDKLISKWSRKKARHLLIHLLLNPRGIHRETLAELIFSSEELDNPLKNLDVNIHSLRKVLEPERKTKESSFILFQDSCYIFNWSYPHNLDLLNFENLYKDWQKEKDRSNKILIAEEILSIYSGSFLPEIDFADNWYAEREELQRKSHNIYNFLIPSLINDKDERAEYWAERMINTDNLNEKGYMYLMNVSRIKKDCELLKITFQKALKIFKKELDETPSTEFMNTYKMIESEICK